MWLAEELRDEVKADVHGGDALDRDRQQLAGVALEVHQLGQVRVSDEELVDLRTHQALGLPQVIQQTLVTLKYTIIIMLTMPGSDEELVDLRTHQALGLPQVIQQTLVTLKYTIIIMLTMPGRVEYH